MLPPLFRKNKQIAVIDVIIAFIFCKNLIFLHFEPVRLPNLFGFGGGFIASEHLLNRDFGDIVIIDIHRSKPGTADSFFGRFSASLEQIHKPDIGFFIFIIALRK